MSTSPVAQDHTHFAAPVPKPPRRTSTLSSIVSSPIQVAQNAGTTLLNQGPPLGFFAASAEAVSSAPTVGEVRRRGSSLSERDRRQRSGDGSRKWSRSGSGSGSGSKAGRVLRPEGDQEAVLFAPLTEEPASIGEANYVAGTKDEKEDTEKQTVEAVLEHTRSGSTVGPPSQPAKQPWTSTAAQYLKTFWRWFLTPFGFLLTLYGLNVVAWGGMLFLLLCNAAPAMCSQPTEANNFDGCNDINSPRRIWIEVDSQILNALFCVTGFGLLPWRARDLYYLLRFRLAGKKSTVQEKLYGLRVLASIHRGWFRLPGHDTLDTVNTREYTQSVAHLSNDESSLPTTELVISEDDIRTPLQRTTVAHAGPVPTKSRSTTLTVLPHPIPAPLTGIRALPTSLWKLDFFIWCQIGNTAFQCCLCGFMWGMNRHDRPSWSTGLFVALACGIAGAGGLASYLEARKVKKVEGEGVRGEVEDGGQLTLTRTETETVALEEDGKGKRVEVV